MARTAIRQTPSFSRRIRLNAAAAAAHRTRAAGAWPLLAARRLSGALWHRQTLRAQYPSAPAGDNLRSGGTTFNLPDDAGAGDAIGDKIIWAFDGVQAT